MFTVTEHVRRFMKSELQLTPPRRNPKTGAVMPEPGKGYDASQVIHLARRKDELEQLVASQQTSLEIDSRNAEDLLKLLRASQAELSELKDLLNRQSKEMEELRQKARSYRDHATACARRAHQSSCINRGLIIISNKLKDENIRMREGLPLQPKQNEEVIRLQAENCQLRERLEEMRTELRLAQAARNKAEEEKAKILIEMNADSEAAFNRLTMGVKNAVT